MSDVTFTVSKWSLLFSRSLCFVSKWYIVQQKDLKKWIGSAVVGTRRHNFNSYTTLSTRMHSVKRRRTDRQTDDSIMPIADHILYYLFTSFLMLFVTHVRSFTEVKNCKCSQVTCHWRNAHLYRTVFSLDLNVALFTIKSKTTHWPCFLFYPV